MKKCRIGILLLAFAVALLNFTLVGCGKNRDKGTTTTTESGSPLLPSPDATLPGENGESRTQATDETRVPNESESMTHTETTTQHDATTTTKTETTTKKNETTTAKPETTTKKPETTTTKTETTTKKPETTTSKTETTTKKPETTTTKAETTTKIPESTTSKTETTTKIPETTTSMTETTTKIPESTTSKTETTTRIPESTTSDNFPILPDESITLPIPGPDESETTDNTGSTTQSETPTTPEDEPNVPESSAGEWIHFEAFVDDHMGAAAYLGRSAKELPVTDIIHHLGLSLSPQDITVIDNGDSEDADGDEWYLILPRYRDTVVRLHEADMENRRARAGELLAEGMHPMLVRCDPEDGNPSVFVELIRNGERVVFPLHINKENGMASFHKSILNITPDHNSSRRR